MNETKKEMLNYGIITFIAGLLVGILVGFCMGRTNIHNNGGGTAAVADRIDNAEKSIDAAARQSANISDGIERAKGSVDRLGTVQQGAGETVGKLTESVERCQQLLDQISGRAEKDTKAPKASEGSL